mmetsp:Transcript_63515/g.207089  ORF Transcript_63515/g.207089 Transcript_63515/m.207089 type:complete len:212 (-) Transcript_63515:309-944(-)
MAGTASEPHAENIAPAPLHGHHPVQIFKARAESDDTSANRPHRSIRVRVVKKQLPTAELLSNTVEVEERTPIVRCNVRLVHVGVERIVSLVELPLVLQRRPVHALQQRATVEQRVCGYVGGGSYRRTNTFKESLRESVALLAHSRADGSVRHQQSLGTLMEQLHEGLVDRRHHGLLLAFGRDAVDNEAATGRPGRRPGTAARDAVIDVLAV